MKIFVFYVVWNKAAHIPWICEGIRTAIPDGSIVDFTLDNCTDKTEENLITIFNSSIAEQSSIHYGSLYGKKFNSRYSRKKYRWPNTNDAIDRFMDSDCDLFFSPQDDQQIQDKKIIPNLLKLFANEPNVGLVGMRDGIDIEGKYYSSNFSKGTPKTVWLNQGEYKEVVYVNDGPIAIHRSTIEKVGKFDENFWAHYADNDYSFRCSEFGLRNFVMGADIVHEKWDCKNCGALKPSEVWSQEFSSHDYNYYRQKWPIA